MAEELKETVTSGIMGKLQPWQALFGILTYVITQFDLSTTNHIILVGMLAVMLGFAMVSNYNHKEAMKEVITPFLVDQVFNILKDYLPPLKVEEPVPEPEPEPVIVEKIVEVPVEKIVEKIIYVPMTSDNSNYTSDIEE